MTLGDMLASKGQLGLVEAAVEATASAKAEPVKRTLRVIAFEILDDWKKPYFGAVPYMRAMQGLDGMDDAYGMDSAREIVQRFLVNAGTWRGAKAREIKAELRAMLKGK